MPSARLPPELWTQIFHKAIDEQSFDSVLPNAFHNCVWKKSPVNDWRLTPPNKLTHDDMRQRYRVIKTISLTCQTWRVVSSEFLFRTVFLADPSRLRQVCAVLDRNSSLGWWVKHIHIARYYASARVTEEELQDALVSVIRHCPNLDTFVILWPTRSHFAPIADALCTFRPIPATLRSVSWHVPYESLSKLIWALDPLPGLECVHIDFATPVNPDEAVRLGSASDVHLDLPALRELSLRGALQDFLEQTNGWDMPHLSSLTLNFLTNKTDFPDIVDFLANHGALLTFLDIDCITPLDVSQILAQCPLLATFAFSLDWHLSGATPTHHTISQIGLHGLLHAFGVGHAETVTDRNFVAAGAVRRVNDINFELLRKANFPLLRSVRVLNHGLLRDLNDANGPSGSGMERWTRWYDQCASQGISLVDCAGNLLGTLPEEPSSDEESDEDDDSSEEVGQQSTESSFSTEEGEFDREGSPLDLRQLLEECRRMTETRDEAIFPSGPLNPNTDFSQFVQVETE